MIEPTSGSETHKLRTAFDEAVRRYHNKEWSPGRPDFPAVNIDGKHLTIRAVCGLVTGFNDKLPDDVFDILIDCMHYEHRELKEELGSHPLYGIGAQCLLKLMDEREDTLKHRKGK
jgi:hypothetical protein